jgi:YVTN family beta-propeller protein
VVATVFVGTGQRLTGNATPGDEAVADLVWDSSTHRVYLADSMGAVLAVDPSRSRVDHVTYLGAGASGIALDPLNGRLFVSLGSINQVAILDAATGQILKRVSTPASPAGLAFDPSLNEVFVADSAANNVTGIDATTGSVVTNISAGVGPSWVAYDPVNGRLYVSDTAGCGSNLNMCNLTVVDPANRTVNGTVSTYNYPFRLEVDPTTGVVFVSIPRYGEVWAISPKHATVAARIFLATHAYPEWLAYDSSNGVLYASDDGLGGSLTQCIAAIGASNFTVGGCYGVPGGTVPRSMALDPGSQSMYVVVYSYSPANLAPAPLRFMDTLHLKKGTFTATSMPIGSTPSLVYYDPRFQETYVLDTARGELDALNATTAHVVSRLTGLANATGSGTFGGANMTGNPATGEVYLALPGGGAIAYINGSTHLIDHYLHVGHRTRALMYDPATADLYTGNWDGTVTVYSAVSGVLLSTQSFPGVLKTHAGYPTGFAVDPTKRAVYVALSAQSQTCNRYYCTTRMAMRLVTLNETTYQPVAGGNVSFPGRNLSGAIVIDPANRLLYVAENSNGGDCHLIVVDPAKSQAITAVTFRWSFGCEISGLAIDPRNGEVFVTSSNVAAIDPRTNTVSSSAFTGHGSDGIAWDGATGQFWVANFYSQTISLLRP